MPPDINQCIRQHPELINYSRYAMQIRPWIEAFGKDSVLLIRFEDFIQNRSDTLKQVFTFLGVSSDHISAEQNRIYNASKSRPILTPAWQHFIETKLYRRILRPLLSPSLRDKIRSRVLPLPSSHCPPANADTSQYIADQVRDDITDLQHLLELDSPLWDLDKIEIQ